MSIENFFFHRFFLLHGFISLYVFARLFPYDAHYSQLKIRIENKTTVKKATLNEYM